MRRTILIRCLTTLFMAGVFCAVGRSEDTNSPSAPITASRSRVVLVRDSAAVSGYTVDTNKVLPMVTAGIKTLTGESHEVAAWRHFVSSNDVVGIKITTQSGTIQSTRRVVVEAIAAGLRSAGVLATNIYVFDRDPMAMRLAGYLRPRGTNSIREVSIIEGTGWDGSAYYEYNVTGTLIWGDLLFGKTDERLSKRSHLPKLVTTTITKLINVPVLQDHDPCGVMGCLYNLSLAMVDNWRRFETMGHRGDPMIAQICAMQAVRGKLVLNVMDGLIGGYAGGPAFKPQYSWNYGALYFSTDPVAVDALAIDVLNTKRREARIPAIDSQTNHVATANRIGLGQSNTVNIDLIDVKP